MSEQHEAFAWTGLHGGRYLIRERSRPYPGTVRYSVWAEGDDEPMVSYATTTKRFAEWERKAQNGQTREGE